MKIRNIIVGITATSTLLGGGVFGADRAINPYTDTGARLEIAEMSSLPDARENKIELVKARPEIRFKKWNGEVDLGVRYDKIKTAGNRALLTDRMEWKDTQGKEELHAYPLPAGGGMEDGGFEIEVYLTEKPATNIFEFQIDNADSLDFFYQPPLTLADNPEAASCSDDGTQCIDKDGNVTSERPENVVGSYAVYHKKKASHRVGSTNYATGKAFHIYRPKAIDANGVEQWCDLSYAGGTLSVTCDEEWLSSAAYPVVVDPTWGYTSIGASFRSILVTNAIHGCDRTSPADISTVDSLTFYTRKTSGTTGMKGILVLQSTLAIIGNGVGNAVTIDSTAGWDTSTFGPPPSVSASTNYFVGVVNQSTTVEFYYDSIGESCYRDTTNSYATPTNPTDRTSLSAGYSLYATYTASGGGGGAAPEDQTTFQLITKNR